ncbi:Regulator of nucleoside diphosphate kinase [Methylophaga frappieri]|uniref:Regulator of nucleoside diphosphate kinase n=1 Tax=Methylophaga frappieri (strain ATCC BAA-2434 / DSM 25690 / JAM7) TaxID=754477 RepID=I1YIA2_METFJ|nr:nucleoside diphosphate kinase regulator [Methylophaga frappieri]AFJ02645.1 Regulator of nucleoside diphosphate kinase [Methylophaga frappieri]
MQTRPDITISTIDSQRLYQLIDALPDTNHAAIINLEEELERATLVSPQEVPPTIVTMNSTVQFVIESTQKSFELTLVYPKDMDDSGQTLSILSPVGSALLGLAIGDQIEWPNPSGDTLKVTIIDILYQPERAGDYQR